MRMLIAISFAVALTTPACSNSQPSMTSPSPTVSMTGSWTGTAADSSGSMMGAGLTASMMDSATWTLSQNGTAFTGAMRFGGYMGGAFTVSGVMDGHTGTFTLTMPSRSMMSGMCSATATGTFEMDDMMTQFRGSYSGTSSCTGGFERGQLLMHR